MKKILMGFVIGVVTISMISFKEIQDKSNAKVQSVQGVYVFIKSQPQFEYQVLGTLKGPGIGSHEFDDLLNSIIKKQKKEYPNADGILFDGPIKQTHNTIVTIIKFK